MRHRTRFARAPFLRACFPGLPAACGLLGAAPLEAQQPPPVISDLRATPPSVDEGGLVDLVATVQAGDPASLTFSWDFGDGSPTVESVGGSAVRHRYRDGVQGGSTYVVRLRVTDGDGRSAERTEAVEVRNVAPEIRSMDRDGTGLENAPIAFEAGASDPGAEDQLTFAWTFGDGATARGRRVEHRYDAPGAYTVTLRVDDGDGGTAERSTTVRIGDGGQLGIFGVVSMGTMDLTFSSVAGAVAANGMCEVRIQMTVEGEGGIGLEVVMPRGLRRGTFPVGRATEHPGRWADEFGSPETFTATAGVDARYDPPQRSLFGFWSVGGSVTVDHFDGERLEMSFAVELLEQTVPSADPPPATIQATGWLARAVGSSIMQVGAIPGAFYLCGVGESAPMRVTDVAPSDDAVNVDLEEPAIEVEFDAEIDENTLHDQTFRVEYRLPDVGLSGAEYEQVPGTIEPLGDRRYRFVPVSPLLDGVIYQATVVGGDAGVQGAETQVLDADRSWRFSTLVEPEAVRIAAFQVARNAPLVAGKTTLARVYVEWSEKDAVHPDWQVVQFPARVEVNVDGSGVGAYPFADEVLTRPDRFSANDSANALNSVNFFGWEPQGIGGSSRLRASVEPLDQQLAEPRRFESAPLDLDHHTAARRIVIEAQRILFGPWEDGVPPDAASATAEILRQGSRFTLQNFPVVEVPWTMGTLPVTEPFMLSLTQGGGLEIYSDLFSQVKRDEYLARQAHDMIAPDTDADLLLLFLPAAMQPRLAGYSYGFPLRTVGIFMSDTPDPQMVAKGTGAVAHEIGHAYGLPHRSGCPKGAPQDCLSQGKDGSDEIEGFRLSPDGAGGLNKSKTEGNAEAPVTRAVLSLMHPDGIGAPGLFMLNEQYLELLDHPDLSAGFSGSEPEQAASEWLEQGPPSWASSPGAPARITPPSATSRSGTLPQRTLSSGPSVPEPAGLTGFRSPSGARQTARRLLVSGFVAPDGETVAMDPLRVVDGHPRAGTADGPYRLEVLDAVGAVLHTVGFGTAPIAPTHGIDPDGRLLDDAAPAGAGGWFWVTAPYEDAARSVVVRSGDRVLMRLAHSPSAPSVRFEEPAEEGAGLRIAWSGGDADGAPVGYALAYSPDGETGWRWLTPPWTTTRSYRLDTASLPEGPRPTLRVLVSDGFRQGDATMPLPPGR